MVDQKSCGLQPKLLYKVVFWLTNRGNKAKQTDEIVIRSFDYKISATIATTPQSAVLLVIVLIAVFSFILKIVEFILKWPETVWLGTDRF